MYRSGIIYSLLLLIFCNSCDHDTNEEFSFRTGDKKGVHLNYSLLEPPLSLSLVTSYTFDTLTIDTLSLDLNSDTQTEFKFIIEQKFTSGNIINYNPVKQDIRIIVSDEIQLQLHPAFNGSANFVNSSAIGDVIDNDRTWFSYNVYNLTNFKGNFVLAPRDNIPYLSFIYKQKHFGWLKFTIIKDNNWIVQRFYINEYCIKN